MRPRRDLSRPRETRRDPVRLVDATTEDLRRIVEEVVQAEVARALDRSAPAPVAGPEWLSNREAMRFLSLSKATLQRLRSSGALPFAKVNSTVYYRHADLTHLLASRLRHS
jgi:hypothetical protein